MAKYEVIDYYSPFGMIKSKEPIEDKRPTSYVLVLKNDQGRIEVYRRDEDGFESWMLSFSGRITKKSPAWRSILDAAYQAMLDI